MKSRLMVTGLVLVLAVVFLGASCPQQKTATIAPEINALVASSRRAQPPETRQASVFNRAAGEEETITPDKHTYTVDPSIEYSDLTIRLRPYNQLKGKILNVPAPSH